jgi:hydrogenase maturation protein HypF
MELEFACAGGIEACYPFELRKTNPIVCDWEPAVLEILDECQRREAVSTIAARLHNTLAQMIVTVARASGERNVALSGGCFQNKYLTERAVGRLREEGFSPYWHRRVPPNDGGIALGQVIAARRAATSSQPQQVQNDAVDKEFVCV